MICFLKRTQNSWRTAQGRETGLQTQPPQITKIHRQKSLERTKLIRGEVKQVFITAKNTHRPVSRDTVSRCVEETLKCCGVDTNVFAAGSTRAASSSKARFSGVPSDKTLEAGGWSRATTFTAWYNKTLVHRTGSGIPEAVLKWARVYTLLGNKIYIIKNFTVLIKFYN